VTQAAPIARYALGLQAESPLNNRTLTRDGEQIEASLCQGLALERVEATLEARA
jgi:hypothetical protein